MNEESTVRRYSGAIILVVLFVIGCMFLYWAVEYWVYNSFDSNRYELVKIQVANSDSLSVWKLDKRTGALDYCTKSYDRIDHFVCVHAASLDAKEYSDAPDSATSPAAATNSASNTANPYATNSTSKTATSTASQPIAYPASNFTETANKSKSNPLPYSSSQVATTPSTQTTTTTTSQSATTTSTKSKQ